MNHIVIFTGGESPCKDDFLRYCMVHGNADFVIAADSGLETALKFALEPDVIVGDMDSISNKSFLEKRRGKIEIFPCDKDYSDTELALSRAFECDKDAWITLVGGGGGRIDHFLSIFDIFSHPLKSFRAMDAWLPGVCGNFANCQALYFLPDGSTLEVESVKHSNISVCRATRYFSEGSVETNGLQWEGDLFRSCGMPSLSNRLSDSNDCEKAILTAHGADFVVITPSAANCRRI